MSNYPSPTSDSAISGLYPIDTPLTFGDLFIISVKLTEGYYTGKITLAQLKAFIVDNLEALEINGLSILLDGKANASHLHKASDITDLSAVLATKANVTHTHSTSQILGLATLLDEKANTVHTHDVNAIIGLSSALNGKAPTVHSHSISDVIGLYEKIQHYDDWIANGGSDHTHQISQILGLQEILDNKASLYHQHTFSEIPGLQQTLDNKSNTGHTHSTADILDLSISLENKADKAHTHSINDIFGLLDALGAKSDVGHTHSVDTIAGLTEQLEQKAPKDHIHTIQNIQNLELTLENKSDLDHKHNIDDVDGLRDSLAEKAEVEHTHEIKDVGGLEARLNQCELVQNKTSTMEGDSFILYPSVGAVKNWVTEMIGGLTYPVTSVNGKTGEVNLSKNEIGLNLVDNTADLDKPISTPTQAALNLKVDNILVDFDPDAGVGRVVEGDDYKTIVAKLQRQIDWALGIMPLPDGNPVTITVNGHSFKLEFEKDVRFGRTMLSDIQEEFPNTLETIFGGDFKLLFGDAINNSAITVNTTDRSIEFILGNDWVYPSFISNTDAVENGGEGTGKVLTSATLLLHRFVSADGGAIETAETNFTYDLLAYTNLSEYGIKHTVEDYYTAIIGGVWDKTPIYDIVDPNPIIDIKHFTDTLTLDFSRDVLFDGVPLQDTNLTPKAWLSALFNNELDDWEDAILEDEIIVTTFNRRLSIHLKSNWLDKALFKGLDTTKVGIIKKPITLALDKFEAISGEDMVASESPNIFITGFANTSNYIINYGEEDYQQATILGTWNETPSYRNIVGIPVTNLTGKHHD